MYKVILAGGQVWQTHCLEYYRRAGGLHFELMRFLQTSETWMSCTVSWRGVSENRLF